MIEQLKKRWADLTAPYSCGDTTTKYFTEIESQYSNRKRFYHNLSHLEFMFQLFDRFDLLTPSIGFSTWYHDFIYIPGNGNNEMKSAIHAEQVMTGMGISSAMVTEVKNMILATKDHSKHLSDLSAQYFMDCDMAILGASIKEYEQYVSNIYKEFTGIGRALFRQGRLKFLKNTLNSEFIFKSELFREHFEERARENIQREMLTLLKN